MHCCCYFFFTSYGHSENHRFKYFSHFLFCWLIVHYSRILLSHLIRGQIICYWQTTVFKGNRNLMVWNGNDSIWRAYWRMTVIIVKIIIIQPLCSSHLITGRAGTPCFDVPLMYLTFRCWNVTLYTLKNKGSLLALMVPWRTFNIHEIFPLHKKFLVVEKRFRL